MAAQSREPNIHCDILDNFLARLFIAAVDLARSGGIDLGDGRKMLHQEPHGHAGRVAADRITREILEREARSEFITGEAETAQAALRAFAEFTELLEGGNFRPTQECIAELVMSAVALGNGEAFIANWRTGLLDKAASRAVRSQTAAAQMKKIHQDKKWWREPAKREWLRLRHLHPEWLFKETENTVLNYVKQIADSRNTPNYRGLRAARQKEKWDTTIP